MIIDTSAIMAILKAEPESESVLRALASTPSRSMSAGTFVEASIVVDCSPNPDISPRFDQILLEYRVNIETVTESQARIARLAYRYYGRGDHNQSRAKLTYGDCFSYALARERNEPLLFVGDDFTHTDIRSALA